MKHIDVPYISQKNIWPTGCESVSTVMLLQYLGLPLDMESFVDCWLRKKEFETKDGILYGGNPREVFCGDPRRKDGFGCYAEVIRETLSRIFSAYGREDLEAADETGTAMEDLLHRYIDHGMPVIFWACIEMREPIVGPSWKLFDSDEDFTWISNEHCMLLVGYDEEHLIFNDPYNGNGVVLHPRRLAWDRHEAQYGMAVGVRRTSHELNSNVFPQKSSFHLERLGRKQVYQGGIVDLYKDTVRLPDGQLQEWDYVHHKNGGGACVVPVLPDGRILMIRQYRPAIDEEILELPAGGRDSADEDTALTARRELREETGYDCAEPVFLLRMKTAVAYCNEFTDIYLCEPVQRISEQSLDEAEEIAVYPYTMEDLLGMIRSGKLTDAKSIAGILAYDSKRHRE